MIGNATLGSDPPAQVYPRWFGYLNIWVAILSVPALMMPIFKTGPLSWQGIPVCWPAFVVIRRAALDAAAEHQADAVG